MFGAALASGWAAGAAAGGLRSALFLWGGVGAYNSPLPGVIVGAGLVATFVFVVLGIRGTLRSRRAVEAAGQNVRTQPVRNAPLEPMYLGDEEPSVSSVWH